MKPDGRKRLKLTISLAQEDIALIEQIGIITGAYSQSEVVRDALRERMKDVSTIRSCTEVVPDPPKSGRSGRI